MYRNASAPLACSMGQRCQHIDAAPPPGGAIQDAIICVLDLLNLPQQAILVLLHNCEGNYQSINLMP